MSVCTFCSARKGKRPCPALGGELCSPCCGKHRLVEIACPADCRWLGGLAAVRDGTASGFTKEEYSAARDKLDAYVVSPRGKQHHGHGLGYLFDSDDRPDWERDDEPLADWVVSLAAAFLAYGHRGADGRRAVDRYVADFGRALPRGEVAALMALQQSWPSLFEVTAVRIGAGFTVRDLVLDETHDVREVGASAQVQRGDVLFAWIMPVGDAKEMTGANLVVPRALVDIVRGEIADELEFVQEEQSQVPVRQLLGDIADVAIAALRDAFAHTPRPQLTTTHGEPLLFCKAHYRVADHAAVRNRLESIGDLHRDDADHDAAELRFTWLDPTSNAMLGGGPTVLGSVRLAGDELTLETHARERLTRGREMLEGALGAAIAHRADELADPDALLRERAGRAAVPTEESSISPEVADELVGNFLADHYRRWLDEPVPALGNRTPRKAATSRKGREEVARLLDDFERDSRSQPGITPELWNQLRRELRIPERRLEGEGLTYDANRAPDPAAWLAADEDVLIRAVRAHHDACPGHPDTPNPTLHVMFHLIAENQLAANDPPETAATLARLVAGGATRHEAIHAVGSVVATQLYETVQERRQFDRSQVVSALNRLRADDWAGSFSPGDGRSRT